MKKLTAIILALIMICFAALGLSSCKKQEDGKKTGDEVTSSVEATEETSEEATEQPKYNPEDIVKTIEPDAEDVIGDNRPLQIESIVLYKDGSIEIVPTDDLKKNELGDSKANSLAPFAESGKAKDIYLCRVGKDGYRVILALMDDGTISAVNTLSLMEDHICVVMDNVAGRDNFVSVEEFDNDTSADADGAEVEEGEGFSIIGKTEDGEDVVLDPVLLSDSARSVAGEEETTAE